MTPVFGIFYDKEKAERSVETLIASEFAKDDVSILAPETLGTKDLADDRDARAGSSTSVVTTSVAIGGAVGLVAGVGALAMSGGNPGLAAGPLLGALAGMGFGGAVGGAIDAVDTAGPPDIEAKRYEGKIPEGGILVTVQCRAESQITRAKELLAQTGGEAISSPTDPIPDVSGKRDEPPQE